MTTAHPPEASTPAASPASPAYGASPAPDRGAVRTATTAVALGVAALAAAIVQSAVYARADGDLDWKYYGVGLGAAILLLVIAPLAMVLVADAAMRTAVASWPAAFGALGLGLMVAIGMEDAAATAWVVGGIVLGFSIVGYLLARGGAPTVTALLGLGILYARAFDEVVDVDSDDTGFATIGAGLLIYVVGVTLLGWVLPATRALTGVVAGIIGVIGLIGLMAVISLSGFFGAFIPFTLDTSDPLAGGGGDLDQDTYITLAYAAGLVVVWALASVLTHHPGFRVLIVVLTAAIVPLAIFNLGVDDPNWVALGAAVLGALVVLLVLASGRSNGAGGHRGRRIAGEPSAPPSGAATTTTTTAPGAPATPAATRPTADTSVEDPTPPDVPAPATPPTGTSTSGTSTSGTSTSGTAKDAPDPAPPAPGGGPRVDPSAPKPPEQNT